ncbi:hypothetical protein K443DRAFT_326287 [Laccaria amethystina LaAM-08-1]|uniref:Uncharacterized protein n=1 Tax=Laccaria amethystina LaAM-08-1 TaxID=1095629 RepID=A0A0C9XW19_9AGAR|nr:hypothetical protein K443DRAFT_326287 [Laccaria amethystina LaAM-08-1]
MKHHQNNCRIEKSASPYASVFEANEESCHPPRFQKFRPPLRVFHQGRWSPLVLVSLEVSKRFFQFRGPLGYKNGSYFALISQLSNQV